jgi:Ca2+ transporting ATPase
MITGDSETIAISIAKEAGILAEDWESSEGDYSVMEGKNFREFVGGLNREYGEELVGNLENFKLIRDQLRVLTKSTPEDKYLLTAGLK